jgi:hypothetical protein
VAQNSALFFAKKNDEYSRVIRAANIKAE